MALNAFLTSLDNTSEAMREHYVENKELGGYVLQTNDHIAEGVNLGVVNTHGFKSTLTTLRGELKEAKAGSADLDLYRALGSVDEINKTISDLKLSAGSATKDMESFKAQMEEKYNTDLKAANDKAAAQYQQLVDANHNNAIANLLATEGGDLVDNAVVRDVIINKLKQSSKVDENGNVSVIDANGNPLMSSATGAMEAMSLKEYFNQMKANPDYSFAIKASGASGSGSTGSSGSGNGKSITAPTSAVDWNKMNLADQNAFYQQNPTLAVEYAKAASKLG